MLGVIISFNNKFDSVTLDDSVKILRTLDSQELGFQVLSLSRGGERAPSLDQCSGSCLSSVSGWGFVH